MNYDSVLADMWGFAMAAAIELRDEYDGVTLRDLLKRSYGLDQTRCLLAWAVFSVGGEFG